MKLITLNTWGGRVFEPLMDFVKTQAQDTDIFCFQEVFDSPTDKKEDEGNRVNFLAELQQTLPNFNCFYEYYQEGWILNKPVTYPVSFGNAIFCKKNITVIDHGNFFVYGHKNSMDIHNQSSIPRNLVWISFPFENQTLTVCNLHGFWKPGEKTDSLESIEQSNRVKTFLNNTKGIKILCGDFNLRPNTQSIHILEEELKNLITKFHVTNTRTSLFTYPEKFADYIMVSPELPFKHFEVMKDEVSDHSPLMVVF